MRIRGQSQEAQAARLRNGCCPVHGLGMPQIGRWFYPEEDGTISAFTYVGCPRKDCDIAAKQGHPWGNAYDVFHTKDEILQRSGQEFRNYMRHLRDTFPVDTQPYVQLSQIMARWGEAFE
jgi:hypothetical protein